jgi:hypothetical protein
VPSTQVNKTKDYPGPSPYGTAIIVLGCLLSMILASGSTPSELAHEYAVGIGLSITFSLLFDLKRKFRNLIRTDTMAMFSLFFLTLAEFIIPQHQLIDEKLVLDEISPALLGCALAFIFLAIGRHFYPKAGKGTLQLVTFNASPLFVYTLFWICFFGGFLYMFAVVDGNIITMVDAFMGPRFSQPWQRGRFGDWKALLYEFSMLIYVVPPMAGNILADRKNHRALRIFLVFSAFLFTMFYGFTTGTRNILGTYLVTFLVSYSLTAGEKRRKEIILVSILCGYLMYLSTSLLLHFRNIGLKNYIDGYSEIENVDNPVFYVDNNISAMAKIMQVFPSKYEYLGLEIPYNAIIRPIPRAIWPEKPLGISVSIEKALNAEDLGLTIAVTYVGEAYMSSGFVGIVTYSLILGMLTGWWNQFGCYSNSHFGNFMFSSGFLAATLTMRSLLVFTTTILPTIMVLVLGFLAIQFGFTVIRKRISKQEP